MPRVAFTPNLQRHVVCPPCEVQGDTVRRALNRVFERYPDVETYVLDDQGALRTHVVVFINGRQMTDRTSLSDAVGPDSEIYVMQALSGG